MRTPITAAGNLPGRLARRPGMRTLLVLAALVAATGTACAEPADGEAGPDVGSPGDGAVRNLAVEVDRGNGSPAERYTLTCGDGAQGDHPDVLAACEHIGGLEEPFVPIPADAICTEQYGGPQTARVTGVWDDEPVDLALSRVDGCAISQWDALGPLLAGAGGAPPG